MSEETRQINRAIFARLAAVDYLHDPESVNSGFNDWFKQEYGRDPGSGKELADAEQDERQRSLYLSAFWATLQKIGWIAQEIENLLSLPVAPNPTLAEINDFTRQKMREDGIYRRILPPVEISDDELDAQ